MVFSFTTTIVIHCLYCWCCLLLFGNAAKPNFIYILTDDQDLLLNSTQFTPITLNNIRDQGIDFKNAFVATSICCPSRTETITGRYFHNIRSKNESSNNCMHVDAFGNVLNNTQSMFHMLSKNGYLTGVFGKLTNNAPVWWCKPMEEGNPPYINGYTRVNIPCSENYYQLLWFDKYINNSYELHNISSNPQNYLTSVEGNASIQFLEYAINSKVCHIVYLFLSHK